MPGATLRIDPSDVAADAVQIVQCDYLPEKTAWISMRVGDATIYFGTYDADCITVARALAAQLTKAADGLDELLAAKVQPLPDAFAPAEAIVQMTDIYGVAIDVHPVRQFRDGRQLGAGYDLSAPSTWFVYDRVSDVDKWHKHCGPYSTFDQASDWIKDIREVA